MSLISTVKDMMSEKATDFIFNKFTEFLDDKDLKDNFKVASQNYFDKIFENYDLLNEFDFAAVEAYLLNNLDNKIISIFYNIKNIGHEGRDSIREDILSGAVARGNGNEKAIRKYCNSIIDFVGACLHDKISDNDKILASEITSVTNEHYKCLVNEVGEIKDIGREILNKIEYFGSFAEQIDTMGLPRIITQNKFSYANPSIRFYGRNVEQEEIEKFMSDDRSLLFWSITGRGGVGKSKFALHICKKYKQGNWKAAWLNKDKIESINRVTRNDGYNKPLLFICDYAGEYIELIRTLLLKLLDNTQCKIRVLLLERSGYTQTSNNDYSTYLDTWYNRLLSGHSSDEIKEIEYRTNPLNLDDYILNDEDMYSILDDFSEKNLSEKNKRSIVDFVKNRLNNVLSKNNSSHSEERCLFLLFTADAFLNGNDYRSWDINELMDKYTERFKTNLEAHYGKNICENSYILLAVTSAIGTIDIENVDTESIFEYYIAPIKNGLNYNVDINKLKTFLSALCEKDTADLNIYPMLPDLVGEFFFIDIFSRISAEYQKEWYKIFCSEKYQSYFCNFLRRCLDDWYYLKNFKIVIKDLFEFVVENNYKRFIGECVSNSFFIGLSYYYKLTKNDLLWLRKSLLINKNERYYIEYSIILANISTKMSNAYDILAFANQIMDEILSVHSNYAIALQYARALVLASSKMSDADDILSIANRIKDEILSVYNNYDIALQYAAALVFASSKMSDADDILSIAKQIKEEILSIYNNDEIALRYAMILACASSQMSDADDILSIIKQIKDEILISHNTSKIALQYEIILFNASSQISNSDEILKIANQVKYEILSNYNTSEIVVQYARILLNATFKMSNADEILKIANQIKVEILSEYDTSEIAEQYARALFIATLAMSNSDEILKIANQIKSEILSEYGTSEIALICTMALVSVTLSMSNADEILKIANQIKVEVLSEYDTSEIAEQYARALFIATLAMSNSDEILKIANQIKSEILSEYGTSEIALQYARTLLGATLAASSANERLKIASQINDEILNKYNTAEIALQYIKSLVSAIADTPNIDCILKIVERVKDILIKYNTKEIAEVYIFTIECICNEYPEHKYLLKEIEILRNEYNMPPYNK